MRILVERGMTKQQLADLSGVSISFLSDVTRGKGNPSLAVMEEVAKALGVPLAELLQGEIGNVAPGATKRPGRPPAGYERVCATLPAHRAQQVRTWAQESPPPARSKKKPKD